MVPWDVARREYYLVLHSLACQMDDPCRLTNNCDMASRGMHTWRLVSKGGPHSATRPCRSTGTLTVPVSSSSLLLVLFKREVEVAFWDRLSPGLNGQRFARMMAVLDPLMARDYNSRVVYSRRIGELLIRAAWQITRFRIQWYYSCPYTGYNVLKCAYMVSLHQDPVEYSHDDSDVTLPSLNDDRALIEIAKFLQE